MPDTPSLPGPGRPHPVEVDDDGDLVWPPPPALGVPRWDDGPLAGPGRPHDATAAPPA
jgi:hypothetical protein